MIARIRRNEELLNRIGWKKNTLAEKIGYSAYSVREYFKFNKSYMTEDLNDAITKHLVETDRKLN